MQNIKEINKFLLIRKEFYNFYLNKLSTKVFRFYQKNYYPPTIDYVMNPQDLTRILQPFDKILNLEIKEQSEEIKIRFAENIKIQESIMNIIKKRNEQFNYRSWLIKLKTWMWKSKVIIDITNYYQTNTLILVHNIKTLNEIQDKFKEFTNKIPWVYGWWKKEISSITIMTKKSFCLDSENIKQDFNLVLIDEAPVQFSKIFWNSINKFFHQKKWIALYWLSGTPYKDFLEEKDLEKYFWKIIEVENNYNIIPEFIFYDYKFAWMYEYETPPEMRTVIADNQDRLQKQIIEINNLLKNRKCLLILTDRKQEVNNIFSKLENNKGTYVFCISWETKQKDDDINLENAKFYLKEWKQVIIIWTIQKVGVWVDIPYIDTIFLASAIKFKSTVIQAIWRGLRKSEWKNNVLVGVWNDLPILKNQKTEKLKTIKSEYWILEKNIIINKL